MKSQMSVEPDFDAAMRALHQAAGSSVSATTLARLRSARRLPQEIPLERRFGSRWTWLGASVASLVLLVAVGVHLGQEVAPGPTQAPARMVEGVYPDEPGLAYPSGLAALEEDPDLYVWLASEPDAVTLEQY